MMTNEEHLEISIDDVFKAIYSEEWSEEESLLREKASQIASMVKLLSFLFLGAVFIIA